MFAHRITVLTCLAGLSACLARPGEELAYGTRREVLLPVLPDDLESIDALDPSVTGDYSLEGTIRHARSLVPAIGDPLDRDQAWRKVALAAARAGYTTDAIADAERIVDRKSRSVAFEQLVDSLYFTNREAADSVRAHCEQSDVRLSRDYRAELLALDGRCDEALATLNEKFYVVEFGQQMQVWTNPERFLKGIVHRQSMEGDFGRAWQTLEAIHDAEIAEDARSSIAMGLARAGDLSACNEVLEEIEAPYPRLVALIEIALAQASAGDPDAGLIAIRKAEAICRNEGWHHSDGALIKAYASCGNLAGARELALRAADEKDRSRALSTLAEEEHRAGNQAEAVRWIDEALALVGRYYHNSVAMSMADCGMFDRALEVGATLRDETDRAWIRGRVAARQAEQGLYSAAVATLTQLRPGTWRRENAVEAVGAALGKEERVDVVRVVLNGRADVFEQFHLLLGFATGMQEARR